MYGARVPQYEVAGAPADEARVAQPSQARVVGAKAHKVALAVRQDKLRVEMVRARDHDEAARARTLPPRRTIAIRWPVSECNQVAGQ